MMSYLKNRLSEKETQVALAFVAYLFVRAFVPASYLGMVDGVAQALGIGVAAAPTTNALK